MERENQSMIAFATLTITSGLLTAAAVGAATYALLLITGAA